MKRLPNDNSRINWPWIRTKQRHQLLEIEKQILTQLTESAFETLVSFTHPFMRICEYDRRIRSQGLLIEAFATLEG